MPVSGTDIPIQLLIGVSLSEYKVFLCLEQVDRCIRVLGVSLSGTDLPIQLLTGVS